MIPFLKLAACTLALYANTALAASVEGGAYTLPDTVVHTVHAAQLNRDYQVFVSLPPSYSPEAPRYRSYS